MNPYMSNDPYAGFAPRDPYARFLGNRGNPQLMPRQAPPMAQRTAAFPSPAPSPRPAQPAAFGAAPPAMRRPVMQTPPPRQPMPPGAGSSPPIPGPAPMPQRPMVATPPPRGVMAGSSAPNVGPTPGLGTTGPAPAPMQRPGIALSDDTAKYEKRVIRDLFHEY